jgi:RNA polymerase sigma factor (sigma-70 family)
VTKLGTKLPPFEQVLDRYGADVWRFAAAQAGPERADDIFQDTMLAALAGYTSVREPGAIKSWLFTIAARKTIDAARARTRQASDPPAATMRQTAQAAQMPVDHELWARVRALPPKQREAVALRTILDLPYAEIAATMATSVEAARRNVHEALKTLRKEVTR